MSLQATTAIVFVVIVASTAISVRSGGVLAEIVLGIAYAVGEVLKGAFAGLVLFVPVVVAVAVLHFVSGSLGSVLAFALGMIPVLLLAWVMEAP